MILWRRQTLLRIAAVAALAGAVGLSGCGRKSGLDAPPAAAIGDQTLLPSEPQPGVGPDAGAVAPAQGPKRRTPLDWLID